MRFYPDNVTSLINIFQISTKKKIYHIFYAKNILIYLSFISKFLCCNIYIFQTNRKITSIYHTSQNYQLVASYSIQ